MTAVDDVGGSAILLPELLDAYPTRRIAGFPVRAGRPIPFGANRVPGGVNFSVFSNQAESVTLVLFENGADEPTAELEFPPEFRIGAVHAMTVFGIDADTVEYGFRAYGPREARFAPEKVLLDPYATLLGGREVWGDQPDRSQLRPWRSRIARPDYDWGDDQPPRIAPTNMVIYETHVRGFTRHPSSGVRAPGTYAGLVEKIPYLKELGITSLELMPVFEFDEYDNVRVDPVDGRALANYWGYGTVGFFAPKSGFAATAAAGTTAEEFKNLVHRCHQSGIEVLLDVVFNHTAEGNEYGPTLSFRGLDDRTYYMLTPEGYYYNFSGTGNTVNCNNPVVRGFVLDCLRHWVAEYHIDGFRFDLAAILGRAPDGTPLSNPPLLESLAADPVLRDCKLIAEAWDAGGLYQVGSFPSYNRWAEWNGRYRDVLRDFLRGEQNTVAELATRLVGSPDLYAGRSAAATVNFVTAHDGFTLNDLVSYNGKHNERNGEDGHDGDDTNRSWNCGREGPTDDPEVRGLRRRQVRNALLLLLSSHGIPMLLAGDEVGRTQQGNNNGYGQDSELSWFDWDLVTTNADLLRFVRCAISFRAAHPCLRRANTPTDRPRGLFPEVSWHGLRAFAPDWSPQSRVLAAVLCADDDAVYIAANTHWETHELELPALPPGFAWHRFADTAALPPLDVHEPGTEPVLGNQSVLTVGPRTVCVLVVRPVQH